MGRVIVEVVDVGGKSGVRNSLHRNIELINLIRQYAFQTKRLNRVMVSYVNLSIQ